MRERVTLERISPALYGWLVWGGGFYHIRRVLKLMALLGAATAVFALGRYTA